MMKMPVDDQDVQHDRGRPATAAPRARTATPERSQGAALHPMRSFCANSPVGREQQDQDDEQEAHGVAIARRDVAGAELLDEGEHEAADRGAGDVAEPAEDDDGERLERRRDRPWSGRRRTPARAARRRPRRGRAEREGRGVDAVDLDAHQRRGVAVLEGRAHRPAEPGAVDQQRRSRRSAASATTNTKSRVPRHRHRAEHQRRRRERAVDRLGHAAPGELLGVLHARSRRRSSPAWWCRCRRRAAAAAARARSAAPSATPEHDRQRERDEEVRRPASITSMTSCRRRSVELAVGEVHDAHDAEDQRQADARAARRCRPASGHSGRAGGTDPSLRPPKARVVSAAARGTSGLSARLVRTRQCLASGCSLHRPCRP